MVSMAPADEPPWYFDSYSQWFARITTAVAVLMPVLLVADLLVHRNGDPISTSLVVLLAAMSVVWPLQLLRLRASRRWAQAHQPDPLADNEQSTD